VLVGSRFIHSAESRDAPIEGEALAVADALDKARYFVLGCDNFIIAVNHKPLLGIFSDRSLDKISNGRLRNLKEKTALPVQNEMHPPWQAYQIQCSRNPSAALHHLTRCISLTTSPRSLALTCCHQEHIKSFLVNSPAHHLQHLRTKRVSSSSKITAITITCNSVTWDMIKEATSSDNDMLQLIGIIESGFTQSLTDIPETL